MFASGKKSGGGADLSGFSSVVAGLDTANQTLVTSTWTTVALNTERHDKLSEFNTGTGVFTAAQAGYYDISGCIHFDSWAESEYAYISIRVNSTDMFLDKKSNFDLLSWSIDVAGKVYLNQGDTVDLRVYQHVSTSIDIAFGLNKTYLSISRYA